MVAVYLGTPDDNHARAAQPKPRPVALSSSKSPVADRSSHRRNVTTRQQTREGIQTNQANTMTHTPDRPNILFIMTDQHRFDCLGFMGHDIVHTPHLDALAKDSIVFEQAYCPSPVCAPARAAIFTGRFPPASGVVNNWTPFANDVVVLGEHLANAGYNTGSVGKLHFVPHQKRWGFMYKQLHDSPYSVYADDHLFSDYLDWLEDVQFPLSRDKLVAQYDRDERQYPDGDIEAFILGSDYVDDVHHMTTWTADRSVEFLEQQDASRPFFLFTSFFGPHHPWQPPQPWSTMYDPADVHLPHGFDADMQDHPIFVRMKQRYADTFRKKMDRQSYQRAIAMYFGSVSMIDHNIGRIIDQLKQQGLYNNTMIVFTADHGEHLGRFGLFFKGDMYESSVRVPLCIKPAAETFVCRRCPIPVNTIDLYATMLETAGVQQWRTDSTTSDSLLPYMQATQDDICTSPDIYSIIGPDKHANLTMIRTGDWKLMRLAIGDEGKAVYELYNLVEDPYELHNLYATPSLSNMQEVLQTKLDTWWRTQCDNYPTKVTRLRR